MSKRILPEVAGQIGQLTVLDNSTHPPIVETLNYEFDGWTGDDILESFPCYIVTERLRNEIEKAKLSGISFDHVVVTKSAVFESRCPNKELPIFYWAKIEGQNIVNDFSLDESFNLIVSARAYRVLVSFNIQYAIVDSIF